jgi:hypothetical protein
MKNYSLFVYILFFILLGGKLEDKRSFQLKCVRYKVPNPHIVSYPRAWMSPHLSNGGPVNTKNGPHSTNQGGLTKNISEAASGC